MIWFGIATYELNGRVAAGLAMEGALYDAQAVLQRAGGGDAPLD
ncbi:MAG: FAA hydrolase family protein, partial [Burkholderia sp.]|nr:FAA hydrolase family protein [Burkholderia sp.]